MSDVGGRRAGGGGPGAEVFDPVFDGLSLTGPGGLLALDEPSGVIVGVAAAQREIPAEVVFCPAGLGGEDDDVLGAPDRPC